MNISCQYQCEPLQRARENNCKHKEIETIVLTLIDNPCILPNLAVNNLVGISNSKVSFAWLTQFYMEQEYVHKDYMQTNFT